MPGRPTSISEANGKSDNGNVYGNASPLTGQSASVSPAANQQPAAENAGKTDAAANGSSPGYADRKSKEFIVFI